MSAPDSNPGPLDYCAQEPEVWDVGHTATLTNNEVKMSYKDAKKFEKLLSLLQKENQNNPNMIQISTNPCQHYASTISFPFRMGQGKDGVDVFYISMPYIASLIVPQSLQIIKSFMAEHENLLIYHQNINTCINHQNINTILLILF